MYETVPHQKRVRNKIQRTKIQRQYMRFFLITKLKAVSKLLMVKAKLKTIILCKMLFLFDIQNGAEIYIPQELGHDGFSRSY